MSTDEPASPLPSASLPTTPSSMRASYTIGTKSHAYTPPAKSPSLSRSNSVKILHSTTPSSSVNGGHSRHESLDEMPSLAKSAGSEEAIEAVQVPLAQDPDLIATGSLSSSSSALTETPYGPSTAASEPPGSTSSSGSPKRASVARAASMKQQQGPLSAAAATGDPATSLRRQASLTLNSRRKADRDSIGSGLSLVSQQQQQGQQQLPSPSPSPQTAQGPQRPHRMLSRQQSHSFHGQHSASTSISSSVGQADESPEDLVPGTPTSISSFSSLSSEREKSGTNGRLRSNRNSVALIENRNIHALSSNLAMIQSPTKTDFNTGPSSEELLSVIAQKEARIQQLREDLETNLQELSQLKDQWSKMMLEERNRQQAEANASLQMENGGAGVSSLVPNRLSTAAIWGTVVGSVSQLSGASSGLSIHHVGTYTPTAATASPTTASASQSQNGHPQNGLASGRSSTSSIGRGTAGAEGGVSASNASRPTSPLPTYLSGFSGLHGATPSPGSLNHTRDSSSHHHHHHHQQSSGLLLNGHSRKGGDRTSVSSQSTVSSTLSSHAGEVPTSFEPGHSHTSSIGSNSVLSTSPSSTSGPMTVARDTRDRHRPKRESSGLFIPVEAEEVLVNTGRALFKGFGSLIGGIRTVVNDVAESDRFQHSRQRTMDMVNGLAQTAADVLPLPSQDEIYYHHQRLQLLDEEDEQGWSQQQKVQGDGDQSEAALKVREQQRQARAMERAASQRRQGSGSTSPTLRRSSSSLRGGSSKEREMQKHSISKAGRRTSSEHEEEQDDSSKSVDLLGIHDVPEPGKTLSPMAQLSSSSLLAVTADGDEEASSWDMGLEADQDLLKMLETSATVTASTTTATSTTSTTTTAAATTTASIVDLLHDTPAAAQSGQP
ncbi:hypothetical protein BGZ73_002210 [Actinomortierella ambigua]|nr:hypothetical protein BGZ73_002210 [Actinomortierella ambigua]